MKNITYKIGRASTKKDDPHPWCKLLLFSDSNGKESEVYKREKYTYRGALVIVKVYENNSIHLDIGGHGKDLLEITEIARIVFADYEDISLFPETGPLIPNCP